MKKFLVMGAIVFLSLSVSVFAENSYQAENNYQIAGISISFQRGWFGIGGSYFIERENNLRLGGRLSFAFSTDDFLFFDIYSSEFTVGISGLVGYNFGQVFADLGLSLSYGRVTARERGFWNFQNSPIIRSGDALMNSFSLGFSPSVGTHINTGNITIIPRIAMPFSWLWSTGTNDANRELSAELSHWIGGAIQINLIRNTSINIFRVSLQPGISILLERFYVGLSLNIPLRISSELDITFVDNSSFNEGGSGDRNVGVSIGVGYRF